MVPTFQAELLFWVSRAALKETGLFQIDNIVRSAMWATGPSATATGRYHKRVAVLRLGKVNNCLL